MNRLYVPLTIVALLFLPTLCFTEGVKSEQSFQHPAPSFQKERTARRDAFRKGHELLKREGVPFDPDELLEPSWKQRLKPALDQMPELRLAQQGDSKLKGVHLAHTLYLPDNIQLVGDTVILVRRLVFMGHNVVIKGKAPMERQVPMEF